MALTTNLPTSVFLETALSISSLLLSPQPSLIPPFPHFQVLTHDLPFHSMASSHNILHLCKVSVNCGVLFFFLIKFMLPVWFPQSTQFLWALGQSSAVAPLCSLMTTASAASTEASELSLARHTSSPKVRGWILRAAIPEVLPVILTWLGPLPMLTAQQPQVDFWTPTTNSRVSLLTVYFEAFFAQFQKMLC